MKKVFLFLLLCVITFSQVVMADPIDVNAARRQGKNFNPLANFDRNADSLTMTNLIIFIRFADDDEITHPFNSIDSMFNSRMPGYPSVYNYFDVLTYGKIRYKTVYADQIVGNSIVSFVDEHPRGYYQPYSATNPIGYQGENPMIGISMREAELLAAAIDYVESMNLVDDSITLDGNGDNYIDNISFIIKGGVGSWASLLWPHMEFFPQDSIDHPVTINGKRPYTFNFEFEDSNYFNVNTFRHEMSHSLGLSDLYHYYYYTDVSPARSWDVMDNPYVMNQTNMMFKSQYLHVADDPIQIAEDGTYTIYSNATSPTQSSYIIKSAIDDNQWFTFEFRNRNDLFEEGIPGTGLIIGRWNTNVPNSIYSSSFFDNDTNLHQYWIFRPGSTNDTVNGNIDEAYFSAATGRTFFGPSTDPYPYLADGTAENSFEISEIQECGDYLTFHVHFLNVGEEDHITANRISLYPNPAVAKLVVTGSDMQRIEVLNSVGQLMMSETTSDQNCCTLSVKDLTPGVHFVRVISRNGAMTVQKFVKK